MEKSLSKIEIEKILRFGAYDLLKEGDREDVFDFDKILQNSSTITFQNEKDHLSNFSKATFCASMEDKEIDVNDASFWEKMLPSFKTTSNIA